MESALWYSTVRMRWESLIGGTLDAYGDDETLIGE